MSEIIIQMPPDFSHQVGVAVWEGKQRATCAEGPEDSSVGDLDRAASTKRRPVAKSMGWWQKAASFHLRRLVGRHRPSQALRFPL